MDRLTTFQKRRLPIWAAEALALLALLTYFIQAISFAHSTISNLDEGAYLLKGYLFATGQYQPFDAGISTNKAPLAFLIPGYVQLLFGPGLRTGRYLAVFFGVMTVIGLWVAARRIGGKWLAAGAVWTLAASPMVIKFYSGGATQSTIACFMVWAFAFSLGEDRSFWQLTFAGFFAGLLMLVRQNMLPVLPLLIVYAFWQHGRKAWGLMIAGTFIVAWTFFIYWPDILQLWDWLPFIKIPAELHYTGGGVAVKWQPNIPFDTRVLSVFQAIRFHFIALIGSLVSLLFLPKIKNWKSRTDLGIAVFLFVLFTGLLYMHFMAAVARDYCTFCFSPYVAFFNIAGILLVVVLVKSWQDQQRISAQVISIFVFIIAAAGIGLSAFEEIGPSLLSLPAPRIRDFKILSGSVTWWELLSNKYHLNYNYALRYTSAAFGFTVGLLIILIGYIIWQRAWRRTSSFGIFFAGMILLSGIVLSPITHRPAQDCSTDVISANEQVGKYLKTIIPAGSLVYWHGGLSAAPLLYLPGVKIFPPQINAGYSYLSGGNTAQVIKYGFWNEELNAEWKASADFFIIEDQYYMRWKDFLTPSQFDEFPRSPVGTSCLPESRLRIFRRK